MAFNLITRILILLAFAVPVAAAADTIRIVGFGDSLMAGYQLGPGEGFTEQLEAALREQGRDATVANAGLSGDTSSGGLARLDWSVPDGTEIVILELGANDMLRGIDPTITERNLDEMISKLKQRGIPVLLVGMRAAPNFGPEYAEAFDAIYPGLAERHGIPFYPFFLDGVAANMSLLLADGMHPNADGVARMVEGLMPVLTDMLPAVPDAG